MDSVSNLQETLQRIDSKIALEEIKIKRGEDLKLLKDSSYFQSVIMEGYIDAEAKTLFAILTDPSGASIYTPEQINLRLEAISHFKSYVGTDDFKGTVATEALNAPGVIQREREFRAQVTAEYAAIEAEE